MAANLEDDYIDMEVTSFTNLVRKALQKQKQQQP